MSDVSLDSKKSTRKGLIILVVSLIVLFFVCRGCLNPQPERDFAQIEHDMNKKKTETVRQNPTIKYIVTSTVSDYSITYNNEGGNTEQRDLRVRDWDYTASVRPGYFAYISAQIGGSGTISCKILLNGKLVEEATSEGKYVIATCSGRVP